MIAVFPSADALAQTAAAKMARIAQNAVAQRGRFLIALSGGSTPAPLYRLLGRPPYRQQLPWANTIVLWGDERLVPPDAESSNYKQAADLLLQHVPIPVNQIVRAKGELTPEAAVADYTAQLERLAASDRAWPRFDLFLLGLGSDGHTASLFPGPVPTAEQTQPVMAVTASYDGRPAHRLTLTPLVINDARHVFFLVTGSSKREALTAVRTGAPQPTKWPAQRIQPRDGGLQWLVDEAAAGVSD